jgi:hypothetical protein
VTVKPYKSRLIPYEHEFAALRRKRPPVPYAEIARKLEEKYNFDIQAPAIFKIVKVRTRGRKVFGFGKPQLLLPKPLVRKKITLPETGSNVPPKPPFEFTFSEHYILTRISPEEAAERLKKIEEKRLNSKRTIFGREVYKKSPGP